MSKNLLNALEADTNFTLTENLAIARATTNSELLNFFSVAGALRTRDEADIVSLFDKAFDENPRFALKALFYFRDVRGGQGERRTFRAILKYLASSPSTRGWLAKNLNLVPEYGRWDDLFVLFNTPIEYAALDAIKTQWSADSNSKNPSLLAKWLPSENASSKESKQQAYKIMKHLHITPRVYRKTLSDYRERINVLERTLSAGEWGKVEYSHVPSQANILYRKAFKRHDASRYTSFLESVKKGEKVMKAGVLYPYDIVRKCFEDESADTLDALWSSLPDYLAGTQENSLVVADVSGSMYGLPLFISISLAIYAAERNKGVFHDRFITFSAKPVLQKVVGTTISARVHNLNKAQWDMNTNVEAVFDLILDTAVRNRIKPSEMVKKIYIVSDMEFDACASSNSTRNDGYGRRGSSLPKTLFQSIGAKYKRAGYKMPLLVFWNVNSRNDQFPMSLDERGFLNVSGSSPSIFTGLIKSEFKDAYGFMIDILGAERYAKIEFDAK
jgi:hypothetical protein